MRRGADPRSACRSARRRIGGLDFIGKKARPVEAAQQNQIIAVVPLARDLRRVASKAARGMAAAGVAPPGVAAVAAFRRRRSGCASSKPAPRGCLDRQARCRTRPDPSADVRPAPGTGPRNTFLLCMAGILAGRGMLVGSVREPRREARRLAIRAGRPALRQQVVQPHSAASGAARHAEFIAPRERQQQEPRMFEGDARRRVQLQIGLVRLAEQSARLQRADPIARLES